MTDPAEVAAARARIDACGATYWYHHAGLTLPPMNPLSIDRFDRAAHEEAARDRRQQ
jgi:hypothetical protein